MLRRLKVERPNHAWAMDITCIPMAQPGAACLSVTLARMGGFVSKIQPACPVSCLNMGCNFLVTGKAE